MGQLGRRPQAIHDEAALEQRPIEALPVERDEERRLGEALAKPLEDGLFPAWPGEVRLLEENHPVAHPRDADEEGQRPGATGEAGRLGVEEEGPAAIEGRLGESEGLQRRGADGAPGPAPLLDEVERPKRRLPGRDEGVERPALGAPGGAGGRRGVTSEQLGESVGDAGRGGGS